MISEYKIVQAKLQFVFSISRPAISFLFIEGIESGHNWRIPF